jgi:thioredoxin-related protein
VFAVTKKPRLARGFFVWACPIKPSLPERRLFASFRQGSGAWLAWICVALSCALPARAQQPHPNAIDIPPWFEETFLNFPDDVRDAARSGKRLMLYFGQDGCPYCRQLMQTNFTQRAIVDKTRKNFVPIALNIWGDREVVWMDGKARIEKDFAAHLKVQFTPTVLFLDERGAVVARLNGYFPPHRFEAALDYAAGRRERKQDFGAYMKTGAKEAASATLRDEPFFMKPPYDLRRKPGARPLAVVFETPYCSGCDELHREGFRRPEVKALLAKFDVARLALGERTPLIAPDGSKTTAEAWARALKIVYTPSIAFFEAGGAEVFRIESYLRPFHLASSLDYVASGAFRAQPEFQRYIQGRAERLREQGERIDLWR